MNPYSYLKDNVMCCLKPSRIHGVGVFALRDIKKGESLFKVWEYDTATYCITDEQFLTLSPKLQEQMNHMLGYQIGTPTVEGKVFFRLYQNCHWIYTSPVYFVNSGGETANIDEEREVALRDIEEGEELLGMYGRYKRYTII